jgi:DNA repair ATPase RecN
MEYDKSPEKILLQIREYYNIARSMSNDIIDARDEMYTDIDELVKQYHDEKYEKMDSIYRRLRDEAKDIYTVQARILKRMDEIESLIRAHSIGVQNVYNSIQDLRDKYDNLSKTSKSYRKIVELIAEFRKPENIELLKILTSLDYDLLQNISDAAPYAKDLEKIKKIFKP